MSHFKMFIKYKCPNTNDEIMTAIDYDNFFIDDQYTAEDIENKLPLPHIKVMIKKCNSCGEIHMYNVSTEEIII